MKYRSYTLSNYQTLPQIQKLTDEDRFDIEVVGSVLPFKTSNYVVDELINWDDWKNDPFFTLTFPQKGMLSEAHYNRVAKLLKEGVAKSELKKAVDEIRYELNPNPAGQAHNVPELNGEKLEGMQHKYRETMLFFPSQGQTCHAYCSFCFRWSQFALADEKFAMKEASYMVDYLREHPEISDVLFTGGDPSIMKTKFFASYFNTLLDANLPNLKTIRIGTKALTFWPYRFTTDDDAPELLELFKKVTDSGINLSIMSHFNHYGALETEAVKDAIDAIRSTGAQIRSQSPLMKHLNDSPEVWAKMWRKQVDLGIIPYYMFVARDTGAQDYFAVTLDNAWNIFKDAYQSVSGICRTVRGPSMSCDPGKIQIVGVTEVQGEKVFVLSFIQGRNPEWVGRPFFAKYDPKAIWINDLVPAFGEKEFFYEEELRNMHH
ncbi:lysine 2,3-aminomutase [Halosquirtibacter xylanolyticus]|uniref:KamA family radical SAM protein n=1 Tax=Halosquirtibacter xylanolyticus TaxID=3374599 RepID=UPI00374A1D15|nr:lysine 2,3-aminomutase [Prolixibacteraceae bacterium]